jgi:uncharacterized membrane protein YphA (DoxX/SURF4 family)
LVRGPLSGIDRYLFGCIHINSIRSSIRYTVKHRRPPDQLGCGVKRKVRNHAHRSDRRIDAHGSKFDPLLQQEIMFCSRIAFSEVAMRWPYTLNVAIVAKLAPLFCTPALHWIALLCLCSAYLQGGFTKGLDLRAALDEMKQFGLRPLTPLAIMVIAMEIGASLLVLSGLFRWAGALMLGAFTLATTFVANRFWDAPLPKRYATENSFFEHLGLVGAFILVAWYDLHG